MKEEKCSDFISLYTKEAEGRKLIDAVGAIVEIYARLKSAQNEIKNIHEALGDFGRWAIDTEKRVDKIEGKKTIEVITEAEGKIIFRS